MAEPSSFRPIILLDSTAKLYERLVLGRLEEVLARSGGLSPRQHGFRRRTGTTQAIKKVMDFATAAHATRITERVTSIFITLDVKNAFNSVSWLAIDDALGRREADEHLRKITRQYMSERKIEIPTDQGAAVLSVCAGVPQRSVLGPTLWNVVFDDVLRLPLRQGVELVAYADDLAVLISALAVPDVEEAARETIGVIEKWMKDRGLSLAPAKAEAIMLSGRRAADLPEIAIGGLPIALKRELKYLGVILDRNLAFTSHIRTVSERAAGAATAVGRLMPNMGGPSMTKRTLLQLVVSSRLLYAAPVWAARATQFECNKSAMHRAQRLSALRVARCYRTVSGAAALVLAGFPPADLLALERIKNFWSRMEGNIDPEEAVRRLQYARNETLARWQYRWSTETTVTAWTRRVLPDVRRWMYRMPGLVVSFHLAQAPTGQGCFRAYLHEWGRAATPHCHWCPGIRDDVEHTMFVCPHFERHRTEVATLLRERPTPDYAIIPVIRSRASARAVWEDRRRSWIRMTENILMEKEEDERRRQAEARGMAVQPGGRGAGDAAQGQRRRRGAVNQ